LIFVDFNLLNTLIFTGWHTA